MYSSPGGKTLETTECEELPPSQSQVIPMPSTKFSPKGKFEM